MFTLFIFAVLLFFILIDVPIAVAMGLTSIAFFVGLGEGMNLSMLAQRMYYGTTGFTLLAVPFFILAGNLMNTGGITNRIFRFAKAIVGSIPGGLGQVSVISSMIFSGMSGSAVADAAGLGQIQHKAMVDNGYPSTKSAAIVAAASTIGPVIPPSIPFVLYGALTSVSVSRLFLAGFIPGVGMGLALMIVIGLLAKPYGFPKSPFSGFKEIFDSFVQAFLPLMAPVIIIGGIMSGVFTPTEASVVVCIYALFLGFLYRDLVLKQLPDIFWKSIKQSVTLLFIMAAANFFGWFTIYMEIPDNLIATFMGMSANGNIVLGIIVVLILILGMFLEGNAIFFITIPIFMPIAQMYNIDLVNFGVAMTLLIMIGNLTPPVGMCLFAVSTFSKINIWKMAKEAWLYVIVILIVTLLITFIPQISTWLPNLVLGPVS